MTLSLNKLENLLAGKGLIIKKIFKIEELCVYLELLSISNAETCMLYIPSKYEIKVNRSENVYKLHYIDVDENGNIAQDYAGELDNFDLEKKYDEVELDLTSVDKKQDMEERLEENYNHPVSLQDTNKKDKKTLREIFRQLKRLRLCVQNIRYKLCIVFKNYLCCIRRDNTFECFSKDNLSYKDARIFFVIFDLETFYAKIDSVNIDIKTVRESIYKVLDKNQYKHTSTLQKILEFKSTLLSSSNNILNKKNTYILYSQQLEQMLETLDNSKNNYIEKILEVEKKYSNSQGLQSDIEKSHLIAKNQKQIEEIDYLVQDIIINIQKLRIQHETLSLKIDKICFDNTVMLDAILKNFELLIEI